MVVPTDLAEVADPYSKKEAMGGCRLLRGIAEEDAAMAVVESAV